MQPAEYNDAEVGAFQVMRAAMRRAVSTEDVVLLGRIATASARINQRFLPKLLLEPLLELCLRHGGCGVQVAHSGTVAGLIFDARLPAAEAVVQRCIVGIEELGLTITGLIGAESPTAAAAWRASRSIAAAASAAAADAMANA